MIRTKLFSWLIIFVYTLTFLLVSFTMWIPSVQADCVWIFFCSDSKSSFKSKGGVRRGPCAESKEDESLIALAPKNKLESTVEGYPTFWFSLPSYKSPVKFAKFMLLDESKHPVLKEPIFVQVPELPGIAGFTLPSTEKSLEIGKQYSWYFSIICDPQKPSRNPEVTGQIQRVPQGPLPKIPEPLYIVHDNTYKVVWYDTLTKLVRSHNTYSDDWDRLLKRLELPVVVDVVELHPLNKPPVNCGSSRARSNRPESYAKHNFA